MTILVLNHGPSGLATATPNWSVSESGSGVHVVAGTVTVDLPLSIDQFVRIVTRNAFNGVMDLRRYQSCLALAQEHGEDPAVALAAFF